MLALGWVPTRSKPRFEMGRDTLPDNNDKSAPGWSAGRDEPRRTHTTGRKLGIHILVVAYRNTTHYCIQVP